MVSDTAWSLKLKNLNYCPTSIHRRFILTNFLVLAISVMVGGHFAGEVLNYFVQTKHMGGPANMVYHLANSKHYDALKDIAKRTNFPVNYWVVNGQMKIISASDLSSVPPFKKMQLPSLEHKRFVQTDMGIGAVKLEDLKDRFLIYAYKDRDGWSYWWFYFILVICFFFSVVIGSSIFYIFMMNRFKKNRMDIEVFLEELQSGNLQARIPIKVMDERGLALSKFNNMADELERLVDELRRSDSSRVALLQELAHDLRTPVASLRSMLETLFDKWEKVGDDTRSEFLELSLKEVKYFSRLVEDLLFLAQVSEPKYSIDSEHIEVSGMVEGAADGVGQSSLAKGIDIQLVCSDALIIGDRLLIDRLLRNGLSNACSFARKKVEIICETSEAGVRILIRDDGKGFDQTALDKFGERKFSRKINNRSKDGRLTVGLGSVIMKRVADIHGGELKVRNLYHDDVIIGAEVEIFFPSV